MIASKSDRCSTAFRLSKLRGATCTALGAIRLKAALLLCTLTMIANLAVAQEDTFTIISVPYDLPTAATREVWFQEADKWAKQVDRSTLRVENVEMVRIERSVNRELIELVASCPKVSKVTLIEPAEDIGLNKVMAPLAGMESLRSLELNMVRVNPHDAPFLASLRQLTESRIDMCLKEKDFCGIGRLPALETLEVGAVVERSKERDLPTNMFPQLRDLTVGSADLLEYFTECAKLEKLHVRDPVNAAEVELICRFQSLKEVTLTVRDYAATERLRDLPNLSAVNVTIRRPLRVEGE